MEDGFEKRIRFWGSKYLRRLSLEDMAVALRDAGYMVRGQLGWRHRLLHGKT